MKKRKEIITHIIRILKSLYFWQIINIEEKKFKLDHMINDEK